MFDRLMNIIRALFDQGAKKLETPEILAEQAEDELNKNIKQLKQALTDAITNEKLIEQQIKKSIEDAEKAEKLAAAAVGQGNDDAAKQYLVKKQTCVQGVQSLTAQLAEQKTASANLKDRLNETQQKLADFLKKKPSMVARAQAGDAVTKANELLSGAGNSGGLDKWEQKIREKEARSEAMREVESGSVTEEQFKKLTANAELDDELAALKNKMGAGPKLIVETGPEPKASKKPVVDENVPMVVDVEEVKGDDKGKS